MERHSFLLNPQIFPTGVGRILLNLRINPLDAKYVLLEEGCEICSDISPAESETQHSMQGMKKCEIFFNCKLVKMVASDRTA